MIRTPYEQGALPAGERRFRALADAMPSCVWTARPDGTIEWYNARWYEYTGQSPEEALGWGWEAVHHPDDLPRVLEAWKRSLATGTAFDMEFRLRGHNGRYRWFLTRVEPIRDERGAVVEWVGTNTDIDDAKRSADESRFLAEAGKRFAASLDVNATLNDVARLGVDCGFADICFFDVLVGTALTRVACEHRNPNFTVEMARLRKFAPVLGNKQTNTIKALTTRKPACIPVVEDSWFEKAALNAEHLALIRRLEIRSLLAVPVMARGEIFGVLSFARVTPDSPFDQRDIDLAEELGVRAGVAIENARRYEREHHVATTLQYAFLPGFLPEVPGFVFDSVYRPATSEARLGGDWYDAFQLADGRVAISVGDVTGHGLDAATMMVRARETLRAATAADPDRPDLVLDRTNRALLISGQETLVTAIVGVLDTAGPRLIYSSAGHPPPLLRRDGAAHYLRGGGVPLGISSDQAFSINHVTLRPDDLLVLYTDGLIESKRDLLAGERRLAEVVLYADLTAHTLVDAVAGAEQADDVAVLVVHVAGSIDRKADGTLGVRAWGFSSDDASSAQTARASFASYLRARGIPTERILQCEIAFGELVGNVVRHAPGPIDIELDWRAPAPILRVRDHGPGFALDRPSLPLDAMSESGRGLYLVEALGGSVRVAHQPDGGMLVAAQLPITIRE